MGIWDVKALTMLIVFYSSFVAPCSISVYCCLCFWRYLCLCLWRSEKLWASVNWKRDFASQIENHTIMFPWMLELSFLFWRCQLGLLLVSVWIPCLAQPHCATSPEHFLCSTKRMQPTFSSDLYTFSGRQNVCMAFWATWMSSLEGQINIKRWYKNK